MPAGFEFIEKPEAVSPKGSFQRKSNPVQFACAFYNEDSGPEVSVISSDGKARLNFTEYVGENKSRNIVRVNGISQKMKEYVVPLDQSREFDRYAGAISEGKVISFMEERASNMAGHGRVVDGTELGKVSGGVQQPIPIIPQTS